MGLQGLKGEPGPQGPKGEPGSVHGGASLRVLSGSVPVAAAAQESWYLHIPGYTDSAHRLYKKTLQQRTRFKVHDEKNECGVGDIVRIAETRPLSKEKRWRVLEIVEKAK